MRSQASRSAGSAVSEVETIRVAVTTQLDGGAWWRFTDVVVTDAERALSTIESTLDSRQPPSEASGAARARVVDALSRASDLATDVRIAVREHDTRQLETMLTDLGQISDELSSLEASVR
jgi:hypothetical protein